MYYNGYTLYVDVLTGGNFLIIGCYKGPHYWSVRSSSWTGGNVVKMLDGIVVLASCEYKFIRVHENLVQHPINNT